MKIDLQDKVVLVTGASRGIGAAIARHLGESGATLALHYNSGASEAEEVLKQSGGNGSTFQANLAEKKSPFSLMDEVIAKLGKVDVLVNNAGLVVTSPMDREEEVWLDDWDLTMNVNLRAAASLSRAYIHHRLSWRCPSLLREDSENKTLCPSPSLPVLHELPWPKNSFGNSVKNLFLMISRSVA